MPKPIRTFFRILSILIVLGLFAGGLILGAAIYFNSAPPAAGLEAAALNEGGLEDTGLFISGNYMYLEVRRGESAASVGRRLHSAGVIRHRYFWYLLFRLDNDFVRTGSYRIALPATQTQIRSILVNGQQLLVRVTIPEGSTLRRIARILEEANICSAEEFLEAARSPELLDMFNIPGESMEGYLFPDTYLFPMGFPASRVIATMASNFFQRMEDILGDAVPWSGTNAAMSPAEFNDRVILASIVEREHRLPEEAPIMAGVFLNRLRIGMALQSCATVEYVITEILGRPHPTRIFYRDLEIRSPFNTYLRPGLPPGPISVPGETALRAAFFPAQTDYLFFRLVEASTGRHHFSRTLDEHIRAGALFVRGP